MNTFEGKKFYPDKTQVQVGHDWYGNPIMKDKFCMTRNYVAYLREKREKEEMKELQLLKYSLEAQYKEYGEVDSIQFEYYLSLINVSR